MTNPFEGNKLFEVAFGESCK